MGWASGSELAESTWSLVRDHIPKEKREEIAKEFIERYESMDCDTMGECDQLIIDAGLEKEYWEEDEE